MKVAFQGEKGAYSEEAILGNLQGATPVGFLLSEQVCEAVQSEEVDMGFLPIENSIVGNVDINTDLLFQHDFFIIQEAYHPIKHCLLAMEGASIEDIEEVYSHPVALAQCRDYLVRHNMRLVPDMDTAGSAKNLAQRKAMNQASIGSKLCANHYGLHVLSEDIQKVKNNVTRFFAFVKKDRIPNNLIKEKSSIAFITKHHPGALLGALQEFAKANINLSKLESRPIPEDPFKYVFFVDFLYPIDPSVFDNCFKSLAKYTESIKVLGHYPLSSIRF